MDTMEATGHRDRASVARRHWARGPHPDHKISTNPGTHGAPSMAMESGRRKIPTSMPRSFGILGIKVEPALRG